MRSASIAWESVKVGSIVRRDLERSGQQRTTDVLALRHPGALQQFSQCNPLKDMLFAVVSLHGQADARHGLQIGERQRSCRTCNSVAAGDSFNSKYRFRGKERDGKNKGKNDPHDA